MADGMIRDVLARSIDKLPDELRTVFVACVVGGLTPEQCGELLHSHRRPYRHVCTTLEACWVKCLNASSVPPSAASISLTIAVPSALRTQ